ncbi:hypothetical protein ASE00_07710 [Sphingomonas sp. Root710]|nr:hypothetical protein ASE00_07710 [Sphingomonas sp. Root710]
MRFPTSIITLALLGLAACHKADKGGMPAEQPDHQGVIDSGITPGTETALVTDDPRAAQYYDNPAAVITGMKLYKAYNCSGCHSAGGGGMGPSLMDDVWVYGGRLAQIHQTIVEGRPNGMPSWGGKIPDGQIWQIAAYVRSLSLPETLAAQHGPTPGQSPAPVPRSADAHGGWTPPKDTTNDYTSTVKAD